MIVRQYSLKMQLGHFAPHGVLNAARAGRGCAGPVPGTPWGRPKCGMPWAAGLQVARVLNH